jgi:hypothetical protein
MEESDELRSPNELHASAPLAKRLLGHRAEEELVIKETPLETQILTVREVVSNYVWAYRETRDNFTTWFPESLSMHRGGGDEESLKRLAAHFRSQDTIWCTLINAYKMREISLPFFADRTSMGIAEAWCRLWHDPDVPLRIRSHAVASLALEAQIMVLEPTALVTFALLDLLPALRKRFLLIVSQHTLDSVGEEILKLRMSDLSALALFNATLNHSNAAALDEARRRLAFFVGLRGFIEAETERRVSSSWLSLAPAIIDERERLLGRPGFHSLLVAEDYRLPLLVDDAITREIAIAEAHLQAVSSWEVLGELRRAELIGLTDLAAAEDKLRSAEYDQVTAE